MRRVHTAHVAASILLVGAVLGFPLLSHAEQGEAQTKPTPSVGDQAPDFTLKDFQGKGFTLSDLKGNAGALLWFTNLCEGCQSKFGEMEKLKSEYGGKGVEVIALSQLGRDRKGKQVGGARDVRKETHRHRRRVLRRDQRGLRPPQEARQPGRDHPDLA